MALLDQLFRLRGAPGTADRPVTLGALVDALPKENPPDPTSEAETSTSASNLDAPSESAAVSTGAPSSEPATIAPVSALPAQAPLPGQNAPQKSTQAELPAESAP